MDEDGEYLGWDLVEGIRASLFLGGEFYVALFWGGAGYSLTIICVRKN